MFKKIEITGIKRQVLISTCMYMGNMLLGFTVGWSGSILPKLNDPEQNPLPEQLTETQLSLIASLLYVGCIPGPYLVGWLSNMKGRKPCFLLGGLTGTIAYLILAMSTNLAMLCFGRILSGMGVSIVAVMSLVYIGEMASTNIRGILLTLLGLFTTVGGIVLFTSGHFLSYSGTCYVGVAMFLIFSTAALLIPESPMFYILEGKDDAVTKILKDLGRSDDIDKLLAVKKEFQENNVRKDWTDLFTLRSNRKALAIVVTSNIFQHCSGVMAVLFFSGNIFEMAGSLIESNLSMLIISAFQLIGSSISPILVERSGRKMLLAVSCAICSASMCLLGVYFYLYQLQYSIVENIKWFPLFILIIFFIGYDFGLGIIPNTLIGEMFTANVRSNGSSVSLTVSWVVGFLITTAFGSVVETVGGHVTFWFFSVACCCGVFFTIFCVVETKGKSLLEIYETLSRK